MIIRLFHFDNWIYFTNTILHTTFSYCLRQSSFFVHTIRRNRLERVDAMRSLPKTQNVEVKGKVRKPTYFVLFSNLLQVREFLSATRTRSFRLHLDQPIRHTFAMKGVNAIWVGRPGNNFSDLITTKANGATVWNDLSISKFQLSHVVHGRKASIVSSHLNVVFILTRIVVFVTIFSFQARIAVWFFGGGITISILDQIRCFYRLLKTRRNRRN